MEELIELITKECINEQEKIEEEKQVISEIYETLAIINNDDIVSRKNIDYINLGKVIIRIIISAFDENPYKITKKTTPFVDDLFDNISEYNLTEVIKLLIQYTTDDDTNESKKNNLLDRINKHLRKNNITANDLMQIIDKYGNIPIISSLILLKSFKAKKTNIYTDSKEIDMESSYYVNLQASSMAEKEGKRIIKKCKEIIKEHNKKIDICNELLDFLNNNKDKNEITDIPKSYKKINENIEYQILKTIYLHNLVYYNKLENDYNNLSQNTNIAKEHLINEYGIKNYSNLDLIIEIEQLHKYLDTLKELELICHPNIEDIFTNENQARISLLLEKYKIGYLNLNFVKKNINLILENDEVYKKIDDNIKTLNHFKIPKETVNKYNKVLLEDPELIRNNCKSIEQYGYSESLKKTYSLKFITTEDIPDKMDILIELGYSNSISEDLILLKYTLNKYKRLEIYKELNYPIDSVEEIKEVLEKDKLRISEANLDNYILDIKEIIDIDIPSISKNNFLEKLEENNSSKDSKYYLFDNIIISRNKIYNNLKKIESDILDGKEQFKVLTKNKYINIEEANTIKNLLNDKIYNEVNQKIKN